MDCRRSRGKASYRPASIFAGESASDAGGRAMSFGRWPRTVHSCLASGRRVEGSGMGLAVGCGEVETPSGRNRQQAIRANHFGLIFVAQSRSPHWRHDSSPFPANSPTGVLRAVRTKQDCVPEVSRSHPRIALILAMISVVSGDAGVVAFAQSTAGGSHGAQASVVISTGVHNLSKLRACAADCGRSCAARCSSCP